MTHSADRHRSTDLALIAAFAALIAVCSVLPALYLTGPVPITLQTFAVMLAGAVLGPWRGVLAVALYLVVGFAGLPVFAGGKAGLAVLAGPTAGYIVGFLAAAMVTGVVVTLGSRLRFGSRLALGVPLLLLAAVLGVVASHACGIAGMVWRIDGMTWAGAWHLDKVFWPGDLLKAVAVALVAAPVHRAFPGLLRGAHPAPAPERVTA
ncbi:biotin transporter BioY [Nocardioides insulae]|uniref:biotin transporter BioY n=1 Tax=Nocardioides insulae TaxID=394734 RepID=UPI0004097592|nr:biotin transporter BioY [Nocardioides insulae]